MYDCSQFEAAYVSYRAAYDKLCKAAVSRNLCRWPARPKQHQLEHLTFDWLPYNGRYFHNFLNEDAIRRVKGLAVTAHPAHMARHVMLKYCIQQCMQWRR